MCSAARKVSGTRGVFRNMEAALPSLPPTATDDVPWQPAQSRARAETLAHWSFSNPGAVHTRRERAVLVRRRMWKARLWDWMHTRTHRVVVLAVFVALVGVEMGTRFGWNGLVVGDASVSHIPTFLHRQMQLWSSRSPHEHTRHVSWTIVDTAGSALFVINHDHPKSNQPLHRTRVERWRRGVLAWIMWINHSTTATDVEDMDVAIYIPSAPSPVCVRSPWFRLRLNSTSTPLASLVFNWDRAIDIGFTRPPTLQIHTATVPEELSRVMWDMPPHCYETLPHCVDSSAPVPGVASHQGILYSFVPPTTLVDTFPLLVPNARLHTPSLLKLLVNCSVSVADDGAITCPGNRAFPHQNGTWLTHLPSPWEDGIDRTVWSNCEGFPRALVHICQRFQICVQASLTAPIPPCLMHTTPFPGASPRVLHRVPCKCVGDAWSQLHLPENRARDFWGLDSVARMSIRHLLLLYQPCVWEGIAPFRSLVMLCVEPAEKGLALVPCTAELSILTQKGVNAWSLVRNQTTPLT